MSTVWTTGWEALPANLSSPSLGPAYIRGLKTAIHERMWNEHGTYSNASAGADGSPGKDWVHKAGSAVTYFVTTTPTKRPDASTAFTASDTGRVWINSTTRSMEVLSGASFVEVMGYEYHKYLSPRIAITSIGGWNWATQATKFIYFPYGTYGISSTASIRNLDCIFQSDGGNCWFRFPIYSLLFSAGTGYLRIDKAVSPPNNYGVLLARPAKLKAQFSNTAINRGWVVIEYV